MPRSRRSSSADTDEFDGTVGATGPVPPCDLPRVARVTWEDGIEAGRAITIFGTPSVRIALPDLTFTDVPLGPPRTTCADMIEVAVLEWSETADDFHNFELRVEHTGGKVTILKLEDLNDVLYAGKIDRVLLRQAKRPSKHGDCVTLPSLRVSNTSDSRCWFAGNLSKKQCEEAVKRGPPGTFIVQRRNATTFVVWVNVDGAVHRTPIKMTVHGFSYARQLFTSMEDVLEAMHGNTTKVRAGKHEILLTTPALGGSPFPSHELRFVPKKTLQRKHLKGKQEPRRGSSDSAADGYEQVEEDDGSDVETTVAPYMETLRRSKVDDVYGLPRSHVTSSRTTPGVDCKTLKKKPRRNASRIKKGRRSARQSIDCGDVLDGYEKVQEENITDDEEEDGNGCGPCPLDGQLPECQKVKEHDYENASPFLKFTKKKGKGVRSAQEDGKGVYESPETLAAEEARAAEPSHAARSCTIHSHQNDLNDYVTPVPPPRLSRRFHSNESAENPYEKPSVVQPRSGRAEPLSSSKDPQQRIEAQVVLAKATSKRETKKARRASKAAERQSKKAAKASLNVEQKNRKRDGQKSSKIRRRLSRLSRRGRTDGRTLSHLEPPTTMPSSAKFVMSPLREELASPPPR
mmetsp:Transcript_31321/g.94089  ORF Transcript_31321/g.94089 Transcript_31321/m.94089 type:complete len:630 (+) Transcript_31321:358-2247(+)